MKKIVSEFLEKFGKYVVEGAEKEKSPKQQGPALDLTADRENYFCLHNTQINKFAQESPESLACVFIFVLTTIRTNWAQVYYSFPKIIAVLTKHSNIEKIITDHPTEEKFYKSIIFGFKVGAINSIWENRKSIFNKVKSILDMGDDVDKDFLLYNFIVKNMKGFSAPKGAFAVQLITGRYGCIDSVNTQMYMKHIKGEFNLNKSNIDEKLKEYVAFLDALKKSTFNLDSAKLWNNWCDIVGHRMFYSLPSKSLEIKVKLEKDFGSTIDTYTVTKTIAQYQQQFPEVTGKTISAQHAELISRDTFKESVEVLQEDYPSDFDWNHLESLNNLKDIVKYCTSKLGRPKKGSSRLVYLVDNETVLKVAYNQVGLAQNYGERDGSKQQWYSDLLAKVFRYDDDRLVWIEMERVKPIKSEDQMRKFLGGYTLDDIKNYIESHQTCKNCSPEKEKMYDFFSEDEFILELIDFAVSYDMALDDAFSYQHWGTVKRDGKECAVLMDYGLNRLDHKYHYEPHGWGIRVKKQFRHGRLEESLSDENILGDTFQIQDSSAEITVGKKKDQWGQAQVWREIIENAGDVLRELSSRGNSPDANYLTEKINKILNFLKKTDYTEIPDNITTLEKFNTTDLRWTDAVDSREYLMRFHSEILKQVLHEYLSIPIYTKEQEIAKSMIVNLLKNNRDIVFQEIDKIQNMILEIRKTGKLDFTSIANNS